MVTKKGHNERTEESQEYKEMQRKAKKVVARLNTMCMIS